MYLYKSKRARINPIIMTIVVFFAVMVFFYISLANMDKKVNDNEINTLAKAIDNAVVSHYAINGCYPESLDVIEKEYGTIIDRDRFIISYDIIAPNIMPSISIYVKEDN